MEVVMALVVGNVDGMGTRMNLCGPFSLVFKMFISMFLSFK